MSQEEQQGTTTTTQPGDDDNGAPMGLTSNNGGVDEHDPTTDHSHGVSNDATGNDDDDDHVQETAVAVPDEELLAMTAPEVDEERLPTAGSVAAPVGIIGQPAPRAREDDDLQWVQNVHDSTAEFERLRRSLLAFVFAKRGSEDEKEDVDRDADRKKKKKKRAVQSDDAADREEARREVDDLLGLTRESDEEDEEDDDDLMDDEDLGEEFDHPAARDLKSFFQQLEVEDDEPEYPYPATDTTVVLAEEIVIADMPERLKLLEKKEGQPLLDIDRFVAGDRLVNMSRVYHDREALWILTRLTELTTTRKHEEARSVVTAAQHSRTAQNNIIFRSIASYLDMVRKDKLDPTYVMMYRQEETQVLLRLVHGFAFETDIRFPYYSDTDTKWPHIDHAFCPQCGVRQPPSLTVEENLTVLSYKRFCPVCRSRRMVRKPCSVSLGRLLWDIVELDLKYTRTARRLTQLLETNRAADTEITSIGEYLEQTMTHRFEVDFFDEYIKTRHEVTREERAEVRRMNSAQLWGAYREWCIGGHDYTRNLIFNTCKNPCRAIDRSPIEWAAQFTSPQCQSPADVLRALQSYAVLDLSRQPLLLARIAEAYLRHGTVEISGNGLSSNQRIESLLEHPDGLLSALHNARCKFTFNLSAEKWNDVLRLEALLRTTSDDEIAQVWNNHRHEIKDRLVSECRRLVTDALRSHLHDRAEWYVMDRSLTHLDRMCSVRGYSRVTLPSDTASQGLDDTWDESWESTEAVETLQLDVLNEGKRVLSVYCKSEKEPAMFALLSDRGSIVRMWLWQPVRLGNPEGDAVHGKQLQELRDFLNEYTPHVIGVGFTAAGRRIFDRLKEFLKTYNDVSIPLVWVPTDLALAYSTSTAAAEDFPGESPDICVTVSIGRRLRDPLSEVARLCNRHNDILNLSLAEGQHLLPQDELRRRIDQVMSLWVSASAPNLTALLTSGESETLLQYVAGLGEHSARTLCTRLAQSHDGIPTRSTLRRHLGENVYANVAGCLRVLPCAGDESVDLKRVLDGTRIHPDVYGAIGSLLASLTETSDPESALAQFRAMAPYRRSQTFDTASLLTYMPVGRDGDKVLKGRDIEFLYDELEHFDCFVDMRRNFRKITKQYFFETLSGIRYRGDQAKPQGVPLYKIAGLCRPEELHNGDRVECVVDRLPTDQGVFATTTHNVRAFCPLRLFAADGMDTQQAKELWVQKINSEPPVKPGDMIQAVVCSLNYDRCRFDVKWVQGGAELSPSPSNGGRSGRTRDTERRERSRQAWMFQQRSLQASRHPHFDKDVTNGEEAEAKLANAVVGTVLFRYHHERFCVATYRIAPNHIAHQRLREVHTANGVHYEVDQITKEPLRYEDLDHVEAAFIQPMCRRAAELMQHRAFSSLTRARLLEELRGEISQRPTVPWRLNLFPDRGFSCSFFSINPSGSTNPQRPVLSWEFYLTPSGYILTEGSKYTHFDKLEHVVARCKALLQRSAAK
eukprot:PhM_4_TR18878/c2_g1_i2/m.48124/K11292/SUPT6H, SPT6; transcription elongation factor SPT6